MYNLKSTYMLFSLIIVLTLAFVSCHHDPGHVPPGQNPSEALCGDDTVAVWQNMPGPGASAGMVELTWGPSTSAPGNRSLEVVSSAPLTGNFSGTYGDVRNNVIQINTTDSELTFCCGKDNLIKGSIVSQSTHTDFDYDGSTSAETESIANLDFINVQAWVLLHCRPTGDSLTNVQTSFPVSVLAMCEKANGDRYEVETAFTYEPMMTCAHN